MTIGQYPLAHRLVTGTVVMVLGLVSITTGALPAAAAQIACDPATPTATTSATPLSTPLPDASPVASPDVAFPDEGGTLTVFAAASLTDAFVEIETTLESANQGLDIVVETAGSQTLVTRLQEGATADVLATASSSTMTEAIGSGLISGEPIPFIGNRLVIVTPSDNPAGVDDIRHLTDDGLRLVVAGADVPAGRYAREAICAWAASGVAPDNALDAIAGNILSEEEDVRNVLAKVQLGEADAGIVYASDATASELAGTPLNVVEFPSGIPATASYPIAATTSGNQELASAFIAYVLSPEGQAILTDYGFSTVTT